MINLELPDLPYSKDALMPYMSAETLELHHDKHHMAYITNGNKFIKEQNISDDNVNNIVINSYKKNAPLFNNVAQHINHVHFWEVMKNNPDGKIPSELENKIVADIVGPICESSDVFSKNTILPKMTSGDFLAIYSAGAYGAVMSSEYNSRPLIPELIVNENLVSVIRSRPKIEEVIKRDQIPYWLR